MSETITIDDNGLLVELTWSKLTDSVVGKAIVTALRELADRMAADGAAIMGDSHNWPDNNDKRMYGLGWGTMLAAAWLQDALSAIERGDDPREVG